MRLLPHEIDKLVLHQAGVVAQKRLARGLRLSYPETVALLATQLLELIRDGRRVIELMQIGRGILGRRQVMEGVPELVTEVQVEGTFPDGSKLVTVHDPIVLEDGNLALALYGSFLPVPDLAAFDLANDPADERNRPVVPGQIEVKDEDILLSPGRARIDVVVVNHGDRPIQVGSHFPFAEVNSALHFDRTGTDRMRLDVPAGTGVRFEPGETKTVTLVAYAGDPNVGLVDIIVQMRPLARGLRR